MDISEPLIKRAWLRKLPQRTRQFLAPNEDQNVDSLCKTAEKLWEYESEHRIQSICAVREKSGQIDSEFAKGIYSALTLLTNQLATLTAQGEKLKTQSGDDDQWKRGQSRSRRGPRDNRHHSQTPRGNTEIIKDQCWYHETYGNEAKKCVKGCKYFTADSGNEK